MQLWIDADKNIVINNTRVTNGAFKKTKLKN